MTATSIDRTSAPEAEHVMPSSIGWALRDSWNEAVRHLRAIPRNPDLLVFATLQPIMFVLLFRYVFGGSARSGGGCNEVSVDLGGGSPVEDLAGSAVHFGGDVLEVGVADLVEVGAFREVLA